MRNSEQIINHLQSALSLLKNQSGWDEETDDLQDVLDRVMEAAEEDHRDQKQDYLRASPEEQARELQEEY